LPAGQRPEPLIRQIGRYFAGDVTKYRILAALLKSPLRFCVYSQCSRFARNQQDLCMDTSIAFPQPTVARRMPAARKALHRLLRLKPSFALHRSYSPQRPELEAYIQQQFEQAYDARITEFLPTLSSMQCQGRISAVAGIRTAHGHDLFVERYLDEPVEQVLGRLTSTRITRPDVIEIGNLSATHRGATLLFFTLQVTMLHEAGFKWAVFAAPDQVTRIAGRLDFVTLDLGPADPARLGAEAAHWGRYYDTRPAVHAVDIAATVARLRQSPLPAAVIAFFSDTISELARSKRIRPRQ